MNRYDTTDFYSILSTMLPVDNSGASLSTVVALVGVWRCESESPCGLVVLTLMLGFSDRTCLA